MNFLFSFPIISFGISAREFGMVVLFIKRMTIFIDLSLYEKTICGNSDGNFSCYPLFSVFRLLNCLQQKSKKQP